jgi:hypothetical protein
MSLGCRLRISQLVLGVASLVPAAFSAVPAAMSAVAAVLLFLGAALPAAAQPPSGGAEVTVNQFTDYGQRRPRTANDAQGDFVVVWESVSQDGSGEGVFARRFNSGGTALGAEFQVNLSTANLQTDAAVAMETNGDFVVVWRTGTDDVNGAPASGDILLRRFSSNGAALSDEIAVNTYATETQHDPAIAMDPDGDFVVVWVSETQDGSSGAPPDVITLLNGGIFGRRFDSSGAAQGGEFQVNAYTAGGQHDPVIARHTDGSFVVAWSSRYQDSGGDPAGHDGVFARRFDAAASPLTGEFQANTYTVSWQHHQQIAMASDGDFVLAWHGDGGASFSDVFARRFASGGTPVGGEFQVNTFTPDYQEDIALSMEGDGDFVVVWDSDTQDGDDYGVFGRRFDSSGAALTSEFQINLATAGYQRRPAATQTINGQFVVAWQSGYEDSADVILRRFGGTVSGLVLDADGNGTLSALTDGLLVLRWAFNLSGSSLAGGATAANCTRCTGEAIEAYLDGVGTALDIDGNGAIAALTDGLLVLRHLFSLTGNSLISGVVAGNCTRCTAPDIEAHLGTLDG